MQKRQVRSKGVEMRRKDAERRRKKRKRREREREKKRKRGERKGGGTTPSFMFPDNIRERAK